MRRALDDPDFMGSLKLIVTRARDGNLSKSDIAALLVLEVVPRAEEKGFVEKHPAFEANDKDPVLGNRNAQVDKLLADTPPPGDSLGLSVHEARAIVKRLEVLEQTVLFSQLTDNPRTRTARAASRTSIVHRASS